MQESEFDQEMALIYAKHNEEMALLDAEREATQSYLDDQIIESQRKEIRHMRHYPTIFLVVMMFTCSAFTVALLSCTLHVLSVDFALPQFLSIDQETFRIDQDAIKVLTFVSSVFIVISLCKVFFPTGKIVFVRLDTQFLIEFILIVILCLVACFQNEFTLIAQWVILGILGRVMLYQIEFTSKQEIMEMVGKRAREKAKKEIKELSTAIEQKEVHRCSVCQQESLYELCLSCDKRYQSERHRIRSQILRAKQADVDATLTLAEWLTTLSNFNWQCAYCQTGPYEVMEHYVPVSQGGGTTAENCVPACYKCNSDKAGKHPEEEESKRLDNPPPRNTPRTTRKTTKHEPKSDRSK